jgi:L,D-transpeptidase catalytic domain
MVLGKQMVVLSSEASGRPGQSARGQAAPSQGAPQGAFGRVAAAASLGLCFLGGMAAPADAGHRHHTASSQSKPEARKPEPPKQPPGPLLLAISIGSQKVTVYDNGTPIASSSISTGMAGHPTPTGIFSVIQKQRWHRSNIYSNAPMPYMQRITWSGVALHAGVVPGYPASHGCIRLPDRFAVRLWGMTRLGVRVIVTRGDAGAPYEINHPRLAGLIKPPEVDAPPDTAKRENAKPEGTGISPGAVVVATTGAVSTDDAGRESPADSGHSESTHGAPASPPQVAGAADAGKGEAGKDDPAAAAPAAPEADTAPAPKGDDVLHRPGQLSLFVSRREGKLFVRKGFTPAFDVPVTIAQPEKPLGTHLFTASRPANGEAGLRWLGVSFGFDRVAAAGGSSHGKRKGRAERPTPMTAQTLHQSAVNALDRIELPADAVTRLMPLVTPGTSLVISDQGLGGETGKETDFIVVTK